MIKIEKFYGQTVQINGVWQKIGLTIKSDKELKDVTDIEKHSADLLKLSRKLLTKEIATLKTEE